MKGLSLGVDGTDAECASFFRPTLGDGGQGGEKFCSGGEEGP